jgi:predicted nucleic acid-binding protein
MYLIDKNMLIRIVFAKSGSEESWIAELICKDLGVKKIS